MDRYGPTPDPDRRKAQKLFDHAKTVAATGQYDYSIELFLQGLALDPEAVEAHKELRKVSMTRKATGGKPLGMMKALPLRKGSRDEKTNLLNAEKLLAYDPGEISYMRSVLSAAHKGGFYETILWIGPIVLRANLDGSRQDADIFTQLKNVYKDIGQFKMAIDAAHYAAAARPDDNELQHELRELAAQLTMSEGGYGSGDFRQSVRNADQQKELLEQDAGIRTPEAIAAQINKARREYVESGKEPGKLMRLVDALSKTEDPAHENEAIDLLEAAYKANNSYRYRFAAEEVKLRQQLRMERNYRQQLDDNPDDEGLKQLVDELHQDRLKDELTHFRNAIKAYPTDMRLKFEAGKRLFELGEYDEAIPMLQQSQADPKYKDEAVVLLGRSFLEAGFTDEAASTLRNRIDSYQIEGDNRAKELHYWFARASEVRGDKESALKSYSQIAQWDFGYEDVQKRIKTLRGQA